MITLLEVTKTLAYVWERFYWIHCRHDIEEWCQRCDLCAARKVPGVKQRSLLQLYNVGEPMECVAIDVLGPLPETEQGNKYILIAMDYFSKWPQAYALPNQEAVTLSLMSLCPSSLVCLVSLVSCTLTKAEILNCLCSRRYAPYSVSIRPGRLPYIHSPTAWWSATTGV